MAALQISSRSAKVGRPHRLSGLSDVSDLHEAQETLHQLGVPREEPYVVTDICLATDPSSEEKIWEDETGKYKMATAQNPAWNRENMNQKRIMIEDRDGGWVDWKGTELTDPKGLSFIRRGNCASATVDAMMLVNDRVCWRSFKGGGIRLASLTRRIGVVDDLKRGEIFVRSRDFKRLPSDVQEILTK